VALCVSDVLALPNTILSKDRNDAVLVMLVVADVSVLGLEPFDRLDVFECGDAPCDLIFHDGYSCRIVGRALHLIPDSPCQLLMWTSCKIGVLHFENSDLLMATHFLRTV
jgi:hypothetical protein